MPALPPDDFVREGRSLSVWIDDLIGDDSAKREHAAKLVQAMQVGIRDPNADVTPESMPTDFNAHQAAFKRAVAVAFSTNQDPDHAKVRRLMAVIEADRQRDAEQMRADEAWMDRILQQAREKNPGGEPTFDEMAAPMAERLDNSVKMAPIYTLGIFNCLDEALRSESARLESWLQQRGLQLAAREAIERMGPGAHPLAPALLAQLDELPKRKSVWWWFEGIGPLSAIAQGNPAVIRQVAERLSREPVIAGNATAVLGSLGPEVAEVIPDIVDRLLALSRHAEEFVRLAAVDAAACIGPDRRDVIDRLLEAVRHGKNHEPGYAIEAFSPKTVPAAEAIPLLLENFVTFQEFDPDREYQGEYARMAEALARYGPAAAPAIPTLIKHLTSDGSINRSVVACLGAIGPAASAAGPALAAAAGLKGIEELAEETSFVGEAWQAITKK